MNKKVQERKPLASLFPAANKDAIDLMEQMLTYNPSKRPLAKDALKHPWLAGQHDPENEPDAPHKIDFDFERRKVLSTSDVRVLISAECKKVAQEMYGDETREHEPENVSLPPIPGAQRIEREDSEPMASRAERFLEEQDALDGMRVPGSPKSPMKIDDDEYHNIARYQQKVEDSGTKKNAISGMDLEGPDTPSGPAKGCWHPGCTIS